MSQASSENIWDNNLFFSMLLELSLVMQWRMRSLTAEMRALSGDGKSCYLLKHAKHALPYQRVSVEGGGTLSFLNPDM